MKKDAASLPIFGDTTVQKLTVSTILMAGVLAAAAAALASPPTVNGSNAKLSIAVFGDSPYGTSNADTAQFMATPAFIKTSAAN